MAERLRGDELLALIRRVFAPLDADRTLAILVDLPDAQVPDHGAWAARRAMAADWLSELREHGAEWALRPVLVFFRNARSNNGDLPEHCWLHTGGELPRRAEELDPAAAVAFAEVFATHALLLAPTEFSATAPLKMAAKLYGFRAATMGGFCAGMIPALRLDYTEVNRRVAYLKARLDEASGAAFRFAYPGGEASLHLDLRFRRAHASGGLLPNRGTAGNLPSGEAYIVPFEGESGESRSAGELPVQFGAEVVRYRIEGNRAVAVLTNGPASRAEAEHLRREPAYGNVAELGLGVLAQFGVKPVGEILLDEKLGLHIAFGRSEHFGGQVGPTDFSSPDAVIHIDRVYLPETQPDVVVRSVDLELADGTRLALMRGGQYVVDFK
jgi:leucyl aminopeptidase (aminopeptidase T)